MTTLRDGAREVRAFEFSSPTHVVGGTGAALRAGSFARLFGSRALVVCGGDSARTTGALQDVEQSLQAEGVPFELLEGIPPNPGAAVVDAGATLLRATGCDVVVGVGGGSVLDTAKAITIAAGAPGSPFRESLSGIRRYPLHRTTIVPVVAVPTLPGSGSETNGTVVICDEQTDRKLSAHLDLAAPRVALMDPAYALQAPRELLAAGLADALCHAIESGLSQRASAMSDALAASAIAALRHSAAGALEGDAESMLACLLAGAQAGQALTLAGSLLTHPMAHPLSARLGAHHGAAVAALEPVVISHYALGWGDEAWRVAGWLGARLPPRDSEPGLGDAARAVVRRLAAWNKQHGITAGVADLGLDADLVPTLATDVLASGSRGLANLPGGEPPTESQVGIIYRDAIAAHPHRA